MKRSLTITVEGNDFAHAEVESTGDWGANHIRRAGAIIQKRMRMRANQKHYAYVDEQLRKEKEALQKEKESEKEHEEARVARIEEAARLEAAEEIEEEISQEAETETQATDDEKSDYVEPDNWLDSLNENEEEEDARSS